MAWHGQFEFGGSFAAYFGPVDDNDLHEHAAYQIVLGNDATVTVVDEAGEEHQGQNFMIRPLVSHAVRAKSSVTLIYLDPQSAIAVNFADHIDAEGISSLNPKDLPFDPSIGTDGMLAVLEDLSMKYSPSIDPRLAQVLSDLREEPGKWTINETAALNGISESRLRAIAREQFGVPLSTWIIWRKLECSAKALSLGESLADAAFLGGFSDQAHFTRSMRRMFGITPSTAAKTLKNN